MARFNFCSYIDALEWKIDLKILHQYKDYIISPKKGDIPERMSPYKALVLSNYLLSA